MVLMLKCVIYCVLDCWIFVTLVFHFDVGPLFVLFMFGFRQKQRQNYDGWKYEGMINNLNLCMTKLSCCFFWTLVHLETFISFLGPEH